MRGRPDENLSSLVSGYFWHITDVRYDANYIASDDYTRSEYIISSYQYYTNSLPSRSQRKHHHRHTRLRDMRMVIVSKLDLNILF